MIESKNLKLRPIEEEDLKQLRDWRNADFIRTIAREYTPLNMINQKKWFESLPNSKHIMFAIERDNKLIGCCGLTYIDWKNRNAEISFYLGEKEWQENLYSDEGLKLLVKYGFDELGMHRLYGPVYSFNNLTIKWYERNNFKLEGKYRESCYYQGKYYDEHLYSLLHREFNENE